ncbi:MAG: peptidase M20, partial [Burkholderiales bacterium]
MTARDQIPDLKTLSIDLVKLSADVDQQWDNDLIPQLTEYIKIPAKSPGFDKDWAKNGFLDAAIEQARV